MQINNAKFNKNNLRSAKIATKALLVFALILTNLLFVSSTVLACSYYEPQCSDVLIQKSVRDITAGQTSFIDSVAAQNNDHLMFKIEITNTGSATLNNVFVRDVLPSQLQFVTGSVRVGNANYPDALVSGGINIGVLGANDTRTITLETTINTYSTNANQTLTNTAYVRADNLSEKSDTASVVISHYDNNYDLDISKTVRNMNSGTYSYFESVNARNNDRLEFKIQLQNNRNSTLNNVYVRDALPNYLSLVSGSARLDGSYISDQLFSSGVNIGSIGPNSSRTITLEATANYYYGAQTLANHAYAWADQLSERSDYATVYLSSSGQTYNLNLNKYVRNITAGQTGLLASTNAKASDRLIFTLQLSNPSNNQINNVRVWDNLPVGLNYVYGSARLDNGYISDGLVSGGINIGSLYQYQSKTITFEATLNSTSGQTLVNYAYASGDNVAQKSAFAQIVTQQIISNPTATITKKVTNLNALNGTDSDNSASVGQTLQYTITLANNGPGVLNNIRVTDVLPPYTTFKEADNGGTFDSSTNQVNWYNGNLANATSLSFTYRVIVQGVPYNNYVIKNTAWGSADNLSQIYSNEVRTTVGGAVKGIVVNAVTGSNSLSKNISIAVLISLWSILLLYLLIEYGGVSKNAKLKLAILKLKLKNRFN